MRALLLLPVLLAGCSRPVPVAAPTQAEVDLAACRAAIMATLVDPESVRWMEQTPLGERGYVLTFNAKNRMGGYAGPQPRGCWIDSTTGRVKSLT